MDPDSMPAPRPVVNAAGTLTRLGGALMRPEVPAAMAAAAGRFTDMEAAMTAAGARIAQMLDVPAALVCAGASAGLMAVTAACLAGSDPARIRALPDVDGPRRAVLIQRSHRNPYDQAIRAAGARLHEIDTTAAAMEAAIGPATAAVAFFAHAAADGLPLAEVVAIARRHGVPVIVDAAAELPPVSNLRAFLTAGADAAIFSGGKDIRGPQSTGLVVGRADLIRAAALNSSPNAGIGRSLKVGKEELAGFLCALALYLAEDQDARLRDWDSRVAAIVAALSDLPGARVFRQCPVHGGIRPADIPRAMVEIAGDDLTAARARIIAALRAHDPPVAVGEWARGIAINPQTLAPEEDAIVIAALRAAFRA